MLDVGMLSKGLVLDLSVNDQFKVRFVLLEEEKVSNSCSCPVDYFGIRPTWNLPVELVLD
ncbi:hypothetical protein Pla22_31730 [Rubripirellula amarantea]|uniref:Uncharacterized protein n=1 Tax=Rubripirellula amarantea TaxID=2527999 RepID=A0A5C5WIC0_9BACT|nr:hypothetical protein Pla22_31730 [Rubripirellula amarantea]